MFKQEMEHCALRISLAQLSFKKLNLLVLGLALSAMPTLLGRLVDLDPINGSSS